MPRLGSPSDRLRPDENAFRRDAGAQTESNACGLSQGSVRLPGRSRVHDEIDTGLVCMMRRQLPAREKGASRQDPGKQRKELIL